MAVFMAGTMCRADVLPAQMLKPFPTDGTETPPAQRKAPARVISELTDMRPVKGETYWSTVRSYYDTDGNYNPTAGIADHYMTDFVINSDNSVTIRGLVRNDKLPYYDKKGWELAVDRYFDLTGEYDPDEMTITVKTPPYTNGDAATCTKIGEWSMYGGAWGDNVILVSGEMIFDEDYEDWALDQAPKLVFDVAQDMQTVTARTCFGSYCIGQSNGFLAFYQPGATFSLMQDGINLQSDGNVQIDLIQGMTRECELALYNGGLEDAECTLWTARATEVAMAETVSLPAGSRIMLPVEITPAKAGGWYANVNVTDQNGGWAMIGINSNVMAMPDYQSVVSSGDFKFETSIENPYIVTDEITGQPAIVSTNHGDYTKSDLLVGFTVPEGKIGLISWKAEGNGSQPNGAYIYLNGDMIANHTYNTNTNANYDASDSRALKAGEYWLEFEHYIGIDWAKQYGKDPIKFWITDLSLTLEDQQADAALLKQEAVAFKSLYFDKYAVSTQAQVQLLNMGTNPLEVTAINGNANFGGIMPQAKAESFNELLPVTLTFTADATGDYTGNIDIMTNAGTFTVACTAQVMATPNDFTPIVAEGEFSFTTGTEYPWAIKGAKAMSTIDGMEADGTGDMQSWIEASFIVPEGQMGDLEWTALNSSADYWYFMGQQIFQNGSEISIDGQNPQLFVGECDASSEAYEGQTTFGPGMHTLRIAYKKNTLDTQNNGDDRITLKDLGLYLSPMPKYGAAVKKAPVFNYAISGMKKYGQAVLTNRGSEPLRVTGFIGDGQVDGIVDGAEAESFKDLAVNLVLVADKEPKNSGIITVQTTAGDIDLPYQLENIIGYKGTVLFEDAFEEGCGQWTMLDIDGDGRNWTTSAGFDFGGHNAPGFESENCLLSQGAIYGIVYEYLDPNNYAVTPVISVPDNGETHVRFLLNLYGNEEIYLMAGEGDDATEFDIIDGMSASYYQFDCPWTEFDYDLTRYAGKKIRVAFRHVSSAGYLMLDDVLVYTTGTDAVEAIQAMQPVSVEYFTPQGLRTDASATGVVIETRTYADGRKVTVKKIK